MTNPFGPEELLPEDPRKKLPSSVDVSGLPGAPGNTNSGFVGAQPPAPPPIGAMARPTPPTDPAGVATMAGPHGPGLGSNTGGGFISLGESRAAPAAAPAAMGAMPATTPSTFNRATAPGLWQATGNDVAKQDALLKEWGIGPLSANGQGVLPDGSIMDFRRGAKAGDNTAQWMGVGEMKNGQASYYNTPGNPASGFGGAGAAGAKPTTGGISTGGVDPQGSFQEQVRGMLLKQLQGLSKPVDETDPQIASEMNAQRQLLDRQGREARAGAAERAAFQGLLNGGQSSGAFDTDLRGIDEQKGQALSGLQAQLFGRTIQQKQAQLGQMMNMAMQSGDAESARALQLQMAQMDDQLRRLGLSQQQSQFNDSFGLNAAQFQYGKNRDLALFGTGG